LRPQTNEQPPNWGLAGAFVGVSRDLHGPCSIFVFNRLVGIDRLRFG